MPNKSKGGTRPTTIKDAKELGLLPSVTGITGIISKPQLEKWKMTQACMAVLTSPRKEGEDLDKFMERVLFQDEEHKAEAAAAADRGNAIHDAIAKAIKGEDFEEQWKPYVEAVFPHIKVLGKAAWTERVLVNAEAGYAGRADIGIETELHEVILDFKTTKTIPKEAYDEHRCQVAAYCKARGNIADRHLLCGVLYISTTEPGKTNMCLIENWEADYEDGFKPMLKVWQYLKGYRP